MIRSIIKPSLLILVASAILGSSVYAQSGNRTYRSAPSGSSPRGSDGGSGSRVAPSAAMDGYCPVCIIEMKKWVRGSEQHSVVYNGRKYLFPAAKQKAMFEANPMKYVPAFGGDCSVCKIEMGANVPGSVHHAVFYRNRLFLFPGADQKAKFKMNPAKYADAEMGHGGSGTRGGSGTKSR